jgi:hypothetical protein
MHPTKAKEKLVSDIQSRLQLALTLSIFFPAILYSFFKFVGEQEQSASHIFLQASSLIVIYMLNYVAFEFWKDRLAEKWLRRLNWLALGCIASFIVPVMFTVYSGATMPIWLSYLLKGALIFQSLVALTALFVIVIVGVGGQRRRSH